MHTTTSCICALTPWIPQRCRAKALPAVNNNSLRPRRTVLIPSFDFGILKACHPTPPPPASLPFAWTWKIFCSARSLISPQEYSVRWVPGGGQIRDNQWVGRKILCCAGMGKENTSQNTTYYINSTHATATSPQPQPRNPLHPSSRVRV